MASEILTQAALVRKIQVSHDVFDFLFKTDKPFSFQAGQFASIRFPAPKPPLFRPYSIACRPHEDGHTLQFCIKKIPGGPASTYLCELAEGMSIEIKGPSGHFLANQATVGMYYFITTGTGVAPLKAMYEDMLITKKVSTPMFLVFGFRSERDRFYLDMCESLKQRFPNFNYVVTLSQPSPTWTGEKGRVTAYLQAHLSDVLAKHYYLCGIGEMVKDVRTYLQGLGVPKEQIHYERYT